MALLAGTTVVATDQLISDVAKASWAYFTINLENLQKTDTKDGEDFLAVNLWL